MSDIAIDAPGTTQLLMGNEAIARGALEAGVSVATAYPGTPSTEIVETLGGVAKRSAIYVEWSVNEKVALEVAAAASFAGVRAISAMKYNGLHVALDFLGNLRLSGIESGLILMVADDPAGISSFDEVDSRPIIKALDLPLFEPASPQEAKDMTKWAFEFSEKIASICILRSVTRISHIRGNVVLGKLPRVKRKARFDISRPPYISMGMVPQLHQALHKKLDKVEQIYESSPFNWYVGPEKPQLLIVTCGSGWLHSRDAIRTLSVGNSVGILKLGTTWPLPRKLITTHMMKTDKVLVVEEVDPFLESYIKELATEQSPARTWTFYGKGSGHINSFGELNPDVVIKAIANILNIKYKSRDSKYKNRAQELAKKYLPSRDLQLCSGCPHRAMLWAIKDALKLDNRQGFVTGDIGCYSMGVGPSGYFQIKTEHAMGSGLGLASGLGKLGQFGFTQPVINVCGDSTFFHAAIPALINGVHNQSDFILIIMDNAGTAMTGFQPHPGTDKDAMGEPVPIIDMDNLCRSLGVPVVVTDPYDIQDTTQKLLDMLQDKTKPSVLISRRECALIRARGEKSLYKVYVDPDKCVGEECGCNKFCTRVFRCPGLMYDRDTKKARIDEAICSGCGVCVDICPHSAIIGEVNR
jgi:indolepyruvate ferredoxin oxidoreductase alpha subunit